MNVTPAIQSLQAHLRPFRGIHAWLVAATMAFLVVVALPGAAAFAAPSSGLGVMTAPGLFSQNLGPDDFQVCTEDCGPDDDYDGSDEGGDENEPAGGDDGTDDEIPVPTRIDTGMAPAPAEEAAHELLVIMAVAAAVGVSALTYRSIRGQR